jgi:hypothetical protein
MPGAGPAGGLETPLDGAQVSKVAACCGAVAGDLGIGCVGSGESGCMAHPLHGELRGGGFTHQERRITSLAFYNDAHFSCLCL